MHNMARVPIPSDDIFSTTVSGQPNSDILVQLQASHPGAACHFVEDKLSTLEKVLLRSRLPHRRCFAKSSLWQSAGLRCRLHATGKLASSSAVDGWHHARSCKGSLSLSWLAWSPCAGVQGARAG